MTWALLVGMLVAGVVSWTFIEYAVHHWLFHGHFFAVIHAYHHRTPWRKYVIPARLVIPLTVLGAVLITVFSQKLAAMGWSAGIVVGWRYYEWLHATFHGDHETMAARLNHRHFDLYMRHQMHHGTNPRRNFGVTTGFWDRLFNTEEPPERVILPATILQQWK